MSENKGRTDKPGNSEKPDEEDSPEEKPATPEDAAASAAEQEKELEKAFFEKADQPGDDSESQPSGDEEQQGEAPVESQDAEQPPDMEDEIPEGEDTGEPPEIQTAEQAADADSQETHPEPGADEPAEQTRADEAAEAETPATEQPPADSSAGEGSPAAEESGPPEVKINPADGDDTLPVPGGPGSHPATFDPRDAPKWQALLAEYEREIAAIGEVPAAAKLYYESGKIWEEKLAQPRNAWNCYNKAFQLQPKLLPNIRAAGRLASQVGNWNVAVQIIDSEIEASDNPRHKAYLQYRRGMILEEKLGKVDEALESYDKAQQLASDNVELLKQKERLAISMGDWQGVLDARKQLLDLIDDKEITILLLLARARIQQVHFDNFQQAEQLYRQTLELDPACLPALSALRTYYSASGKNDLLLGILQSEAKVTTEPTTTAWLLYQAARLLRVQEGDDDQALETLSRALNLVPGNHMILTEMASIYENLMRWQELVEIYEQMVEVITDRQEQVSLHFKLGSIWEEKLFNEDRAITHYRKVVELNPSYLPALQGLGKLFYRKGQWDELVQMYEIEIGETDDPKPKSVKLYKLAEILEERLSRDEDAIAKLEQCLEMSPGYLPALKALGRLYSKYNRFESLIHMYEKELEVTQDHDQSVFLLDKIGLLWEEKLNNIDKAIETYQRLLEISPNYLPAIRTLGKLYVRADRWEDLIQINDLEAQLINDQKQVVSLLHRNGEIYEEKLNDKDKAIEMYKKVLALSPAYLPALQSLGRLYFIKGRWEDLIAMHRQEIEVTLNEDQQIALLYKIGELYEEKLVQEDKAIVAYQEVLRIQKTNFPAMKALIRIFTNKRDYESLIEIYEIESSILEDPQQKSLSLFRVAEIYENNLSQPDKAIESLQAILQTAPQHVPTLRSLARLYTQKQDWRGLLDIYEREIQNTSNDNQQVQTLGDMAEVYASKINDVIRAAECYERILSIKPNHLQSLEALERIYLSQRNYNALIGVYEALFAKTTDKQLRMSLQAQIADLRENRLQPPQNAGENHLKVLELDPDHPMAIRSLDILYHKYGTWRGLRLLYERELKSLSSKEEGVDLCMRIADLAENKLESPDVAVHYYQEVLRLDPDHLPAIKALKRIKTAQGDHQAMIGLLDREGQVTRDPRQSMATLLEAAQIYLERFEDPHKATECLFKVLERDPTEVQAFSQLEALLIQQADWERLAVLYHNRVGVTDDSRILSELHLKLGGLYREQLQRPQDAAKAFREVLAINPSHVQAVATLSELAFDMEQWDECIELCSRLQELTNDTEILAPSHYRLGVIYQEKKPDLEHSVQHFEKALELKPGELSTLERLKAIRVARQQWDEAEKVLGQLIEVDSDPEERLKHLMEQADIYETGLGDPERAVEALRRIQELDPNNTSVIERLGELYEKLERWQDLVDSYHAFIRLLPPDREQDAVPLHIKMGKIFSEKLDNTDKAILEYKRATEINPRHIEAHEALAALYGSTGLYYANAVDEHRKLLEINPFRIGSFHELRRIFEEQRVFDKVLCTCSVLHYLRAADQNEEFFYGENKSKIPERSDEVLSAEDMENLVVHPGEKGVIRKILKLVGPHLTKVYAPNLERHGVGKGNRARPDDPLRTLCNGMAANIGEIEYELYHSTQPTHLVGIENSSPPALVVGEGLVKRTVVKEQRFALGRALKRLSDGSFLAAILGPKELARLMAALVQPHHPNCPLVTFPSDLPPDMPKRVTKALPRKTRKALEELLRSIAPDLARVPDYENYIRQSEFSANHFGLLMCNDLPQAAMHILRESPDLRDKRFNTTEEISSELSKHQGICDLLRFAVSEEYFRLRARMKFSIVG